MIITVITVTYNCKDTIERTINSVLRQDYDDYEYIIIDGASYDGTEDIISNYKEQLSYFVSEPDNGIYDAMNKGIRNSTGEIILFLNGDDYFYNNNVLSDISRHYIDNNTIIMGKVKYGNVISEQIDINSYVSPYCMMFYPHQATFVPKEIYNKLGLYDEQYGICADYEFICRAIYNKIDILGVDVIVSQFSLGGRSNSIGAVADAYLISNRYMKLSGESRLFPELFDMTICKLKNMIFNSMLNDDKYASDFRDFFFRVYSRKKKIQVWGIGTVGKRFVCILKKCGIDLDSIIDNKEFGGDYEGIPVYPYSKERAKSILITTSLYDDEIADVLLADGFEEKKDFFKFSYIRDYMVSLFDHKEKALIDFECRTGLHVDLSYGECSNSNTNISP